MATEGGFPKDNGDILFASEANDFYNYPKLLLSSTLETDTFTPTKSDSRIIVWVKGNFRYNGTTEPTVTLNLDIDSVTKDSVSKLVEMHGSPTGNSRVPFALMYTDVDLAVASHDIDLTVVNGGTTTTLENINIIVMEYTKE